MIRATVVLTLVLTLFACGSYIETCPAGFTMIGEKRSETAIGVDGKLAFVSVDTRTCIKVVGEKILEAELILVEVEK